MLTCNVVIKIYAWIQIYEMKTFSLGHLPCLFMYTKEEEFLFLTLKTYESLTCCKITSILYLRIYKKCICLSNTNIVEYEKHFLLKCPKYTYIKSQFQNICYNINLLNFLTHKNYGDLGTNLISMDHRRHHHHHH